MCDKDTLESCQVKWEGREFSSFSRFAASLRHMSCCNRSRRERKSPPPRACCCSRGLYYLSAQAQKVTSLLMLFHGAGCLQLSLCQHFVARKAAAAERNPYLAASALRPFFPCASFIVAVSAAIYFLWSLSLFSPLLLAEGLAVVWQGCPGGAELGCSRSRCLGRTWRGAVPPALAPSLSPRDQVKKGSGLQLKDPQHGAFSQQWWKCTACFLRRPFQAKVKLPYKGLSFFIV